MSELTLSGRQPYRTPLVSPIGPGESRVLATEEERSFKSAFTADSTDPTSRTKLEEKYGKAVEDLLEQHATNEDSGKKTGHDQILAGLMYQLVHHAENYSTEVQVEIAAQFAKLYLCTTLPALNDRSADSLRLRTILRVGRSESADSSCWAGMGSSALIDVCSTHWTPSLKMAILEYLRHH